MSKIKVINDRCPLQGECGRKKCEHKFCERECSYYQGNARPGAEIEDQQQAMEEEWEARMSAPSVLADTSAPATPQDVEPVVVQGDTGSLVMLPVDKLLPHPDNPRKDLGDLQELADSIKANGVLQNLTVVSLGSEAAEWSALSQQYQEHPTEEVRNLMNRITANQPKDSEGLFRVVIGHRRLAAAKLAGLAEVPCVISNMDYREQVRTMLMENIQRSDLTVYEQAQGFQMMLDLGDNVDDIARKSGFSQTTVRRRVKLLELDQEKFKKSVERGANLMDYIELDKIKDIKLKNEVLDAIGTNNFKMKLAGAIEKEKSHAIITKRVQELSAFATEVKDVNYSTMRYVRNFGTWNKKDEIMRPEDADTVAYFYRVGSSQVDLYRQIVEEPKDSDLEARAEQVKAERERRHAELESASKAAYLSRFAFVKSFSATKRSAEVICRFATGAFLRERDDPDDDMMSELLDIAIDPDTDEIDINAFEEKSKANPEYTLLVTAYASLDSEGMNYIWWHWETDVRGMVCSFEKNEILDFLYGILTDLGYEMSDEEKALRDGTHELFREGDAATHEEKEAAQDE